jgi:hypothetical protein
LSSCGLADERRWLLRDEALPLLPEPLPLLPEPLCELRLRLPEDGLRVPRLVDEDLGEEELPLLDLALSDFERRAFASCFAIDHLSFRRSLALLPRLQHPKTRFRLACHRHRLCRWGAVLSSEFGENPAAG